jgi:hypothetical protein
MIDLPAWHEAVGRMETFLRSQGHSTTLHWVFRDDLWARSQHRLFVRWPLPPTNVALGQAVFEAGRKKGLIELTALAQFGDSVVATVWYPKFPDEEVQGWDQNLRLSIRNPLVKATAVPRLAWMALQRTPWYRRYQERAAFVGSKEWAAA